MPPAIVAGSAHLALAERVGAVLGVAPCGRTLERFADGELHVDITDSLRGRDVYIVQPTSPPVDQHLVELLFLADACVRAGAARITAVMPYLGYARQDRRAEGREAVGAAAVARMIEACGVARVVAVDVHTPALEGFFRIPFEHLGATRLLAASLRTPANPVIVAPDLGAAKLAERVQRYLQAPVAVIHKTRRSGSTVAVRTIIGDVRGRTPVIVDDMITTGGTMEAAVRELLAAGCTPPAAVLATHGLFVGPAVARLDALPVEPLIATDTVVAAARPAHLQVVSVAPLLADAIGRLHRGESLTPILARA